jgi:hypothetical protein
MTTKRNLRATPELEELLLSLSMSLRVVAPILRTFEEEANTGILKNKNALTESRICLECLNMVSKKLVDYDNSVEPKE